jgi:hypothetical protein
VIIKEGNIMRFVFALVLVALTAAFLAAPAAVAQETKPIQLALVNPIQLVNEDYSVKGLRISLIYGVNRDLSGLDLSLVGQNSGDVRGLQVALAGLTEGDFTGVQWALVGLTNGNFTGWQDNAVNIVDGKMSGLQAGIFNQSRDAEGVLLGWVNITGHMSGFQLALFNMTDTLNGLQVGVVNVVKQGTSHPVLPLVNWSFD